MNIENGPFVYLVPSDQSDLLFFMSNSNLMILVVLKYYYYREKVCPITGTKTIFCKTTGTKVFPNKAENSFAK